MHISERLGLARVFSFRSAVAIAQLMFIALMALLIGLAPTVLAQSQSSDATSAA